MEKSESIQNIKEDKNAANFVRSSSVPHFNYAASSSLNPVIPGYPSVPAIPGTEFESMSMSSSSTSASYYLPSPSYYQYPPPYPPGDPNYTHYYESAPYEIPVKHPRTSRSLSKCPYEKTSTLSKSSSHSANWKHSESRYDRDKDKRSSYKSSSYSKPYSSSNRSRDRSYSPRRPERSTSPKYKREERKSRRPETERDRLLAKWRKNYCETSADISRKLEELANDEEKGYWIRSSPADVYYKRTKGNEVESTTRLAALCTLFEDELMKRSAKAKEKQEPYEPPPRKRKVRTCRHKTDKCSSSDSSDSDLDLEEDRTMEELSRKTQHPYRLHSDLWHNESGEMNDGPLCRCSAKSRRSGIRHGIYPGETGFEKCLPNSNNADRLYHYRITISPPTNFLTKTPTIIKYDAHEFLFEGFSLLTHEKIEELPTCKVIRFNIEYTILYVEEKMPENFTIRELDLFYNFLFVELLELIDFSLKPSVAEGDTCSCYHFYPRFVRDLPDNGKEVLAMSEVLRYLLDNSGPLVDKKTLSEMMEMGQYEWQDYVDEIKGMVVTNPGMKPCSVRVDQLDRNVSDLPDCIDADGTIHPVIVHFGIRPPQLSYAGNPEYQKAWREYVKFRHLIANMSKPSFEDKRKLETKENRLQEMRSQGRMKRNVTVAIPSRNFHRTGLMCDIIQHAMLIPVLTTHLRFHRSLNALEDKVDYKFKNRYLLQLALTHPSYKENFGTNPDHARNSLTNCGIRQPEYGDRKIHYMNTRKRGINTLINIMSRFGKEFECDSNITHNERLEFLGDAVVEFLTSIHLFHMFPDLEEGGLATYRAAIVQNQHLAVLAKKLQLEEFMLYAHGSDLCHELELRHALANCFEALMGALLLDGEGVKVPDKVFSYALWHDNNELKGVWDNYPAHPLQEQEPDGDRHWISNYELLKKLTTFEAAIGVEFKHIRLLARAFTDRSIGFTNLTLGSNQRLEFLGDTVLQLICSEYLYLHFPEHHEGHLSLLRSSLVNNRTQAVVCDDLGMTKFAVYSNPKAELKTKDRADLLEAFLGALYVDHGLEYCEVFCNVCLFPRLQDFIMNQDWNDPKSKLQQCCLTLRTMDGSEPDIPYYKVVESTGPTNTRVYKVAVYFRDKRLASATGHSIQQAEMNAAKKALENSKDLFPQLDHQKRVIAKSMRRQRVMKSNENLNIQSGGSAENLNEHSDTEKKSSSSSKLPKQYRRRGGALSDVSEISSMSFDSSSDKETEIVKKRRKRSGKGKISKKQRKQTNSDSDTDSSEIEEIEEIEENVKDKNIEPVTNLVPLVEYSSLSDSDNFDDFNQSEEIKCESEELNDSAFPDSNEIEENATEEIKTEKISDDELDVSFENENEENGGESSTSKYEKYVYAFKVEGTEDFSDAESGELV